jgi:hypothetical protein
MYKKIYYKRVAVQRRPKGERIICTQGYRKKNVNENLSVNQLKAKDKNYRHSHYLTPSLSLSESLTVAIMTWYTVPEYLCTNSGICVGKKPEYPERTTEHGQATGKLYHLWLRVECPLLLFTKPGANPRCIGAKQLKQYNCINSHYNQYINK